MKVTLIGTLPPIKALSPYCYHLADALSKKIIIEFINFKSVLPKVLYYGGEKEKKSYTFKNFKTSNIINWYNPFSWIKAGLKVNGEIAHFQHWQLYSSLIYCFILPIVKIRGKKIIISVHNITPHTAKLTTVFLDKIFNKIIFPYANFIIVHNKRNRKKLLERYKLDENKIFMIPHGTLRPYQKLKNISKQSARKYLNIPFDKKVILFFGYIWEYKGLDILLKSLRIIRDSTKDVVLVIAGQPLRNWKKYEKIIKENRIDDCIIKVLRYIPDSEVEYYFSCSDIVALSYNQHPFDTHGGVGALALSFKKPMIVTDVGGLPEYVKDKRVISEPNNINELAKKIIFVLNKKSILKKLSKESEELSKELSWDKIANTTIKVYNKIQ